MHCVTDVSEICYKCAAKYHKVCTMHDTAELVELDLKLIDAKLMAINGKEGPDKSTEAASITKEDVENHLMNVKKDMNLYKKKMEDVKSELIRRIEKEFQELEERGNKLITKLEDTYRQLAEDEQSKEETKRKLELLRLSLLAQTSDKNFENVVAVYKRLKSEEEHSVSDPRKVQKLKEKIDGFCSDKKVQNIVDAAKKAFELVQNRKDTQFQEFKNLLYLFTPYSCFFYTYDVDEKVASVIKLVEKDKGEFRMKFNSATLLYNNRIYLIGGTDTLDACGDRCWFYAFLTDNVSEMKKMKLARREHSAVSANGYIYAVGGWTDGGLTNVCEKVCVDTVARGSNDDWINVRKLNFARSALSLCSFDDSTIYAIGGLAKDRKAGYIERLMVQGDIYNSTTPSDSNNFWDKMEVADPDQFAENYPMVGSFGFSLEANEHTLIIFSGEEKKENSVAYTWSLNDKTLTKIASPDLAGTGSLHNRKPLYMNGGKDIYFVGFYDILNFNAETMAWLKPVETCSWISYK